MNQRPCKYCHKMREEHYTNATTYPLCQDITDMKTVSWQFTEMDNLQYLEWKHGKKLG